MSNIKTREEIRTELKDIANQSGLTGSGVDLMISLTATAYYNTLLHTINITKELNSDTLANINSAIALACDRMYSVFRGNNPVIRLNAQFSEVIDFKRGQVVAELDDFKLFIKNSLTTKPANEVTEIELIASTEYVEIENKDKGLGYYIEFLIDNLSADCILLQNNKELEVTTIFRDHLVDKIPFELTISDFGVRYYFNPDTTTYEESVRSSSSSIDKLIDRSLVLSGFKYISDLDLQTVLVSDLNISDKILNLNTASIECPYNSTTNGVTSDLSKGIERETLDQIISNYKNQIYEIGVIRSNTDLCDLLKEVYKKYLIDIDYYYDNSSIHFKYIPKLDITIDKNYLRNLLYNKSQYYLFEPGATDGGVTIEEANKLILSLYLTIVTTNASKVSEYINNYITNYNKKFNVNISYTKILTDLSKCSDVVDIKEFRIIDIVNNRDLTGLVTEKLQYFDITLDLNYEVY